LKRIAVFCGSSSGSKENYIKEAIMLGKELAKRNITLVYGGASVGIMGAVADSVLEEGGQAIGVMPTFLKEKEISHQNLSELIIVNSMHERKAKLSEMADGFIVLPGGPGTLEEFFEIYTALKLGLHQKPVGLLNIDHYYDPLISLFDHMCKEGFLKMDDDSILIIEENPNLLLDQFEKMITKTVKSETGSEE